MKAHLLRLGPALTAILTVALVTMMAACDTGEVGSGELSDDSNQGTRVPTVVGGTEDTGHPSVGALVDPSTDWVFCTGTLIGRRHVLTAAHCVMTGACSSSAVQLRRAADVNVRFGNRDYLVASVTAHSLYRDCAGHQENDVAILTLKGDVSGITPSPLATNAVKVGWPMTLVGYGLTGQATNDSGIKRVGHSQVWEVWSKSYRYGAQPDLICNGDSGGPNFVETASGQEVVVGVHSYGDGTCTTQATDMMVSAYQTWIATVTEHTATRPVLTFVTATPAQSSTTTPTGSRKEGETCSTQLRCVDGTTCVSLTNQREDGTSYVALSVCMTVCKTPYGDPICNGGEVCTPAGSEAVCFNANSPDTNYVNGKSTMNSAPPAKEGQACSTTQKCATGLTCITVKDHGNFCMTNCQTIGADPRCDGGEQCTAASNTVRVCYDKNSPATGFTD